MLSYSSRVSHSINSKKYKVQVIKLNEKFIKFELLRNPGDNIILLSVDYCFCKP